MGRNCANHDSNRGVISISFPSSAVDSLRASHLIRGGAHNSSLGNNNNLSRTGREGEGSSGRKCLLNNPTNLPFQSSEIGPLEGDERNDTMCVKLLKRSLAGRHRDKREPSIFTLDRLCFDNVDTIHVTW